MIFLMNGSFSIIMILISNKATDYEWFYVKKFFFIGPIIHMLKLKESFYLEGSLIIWPVVFKPDDAVGENKSDCSCDGGEGYRQCLGQSGLKQIMEEICLIWQGSFHC